MTTPTDGNGSSAALRKARSLGALLQRMSLPHPPAITAGRTYAEKCLLIECANMASRAPPGVYAMPLPDAPTRWHGVVFVHHGPLSGAVFRFVLQATEAYPSQMPILRFTAPPWHPLVDPLTGVIDTSHAFPKWDPDTMFVWHLFQFMASTLASDFNDLAALAARTNLNRDPICTRMHSHTRRSGRGKVPVNNDAVALLLSGDSQSYRIRASKSASESTNYLYEDPDSEIKFSPWNLDVHDRVLNSILTAPSSDATVNHVIRQIQGDSSSNTDTHSHNNTTLDCTETSNGSDTCTRNTSDTDSNDDNDNNDIQHKRSFNFFGIRRSSSSASFGSVSISSIIKWGFQSQSHD